jgi:outer membrane protein TolC
MKLKSFSFLRDYLFVGQALSLVISLVIVFGLSKAWALQLTEEFVSEQISKSSLDEKILESQQQRSNYILTQTEGLYDPAFYGSLGFEDSKSESLSGLSSDHDKTLNYIFGLQKKYSTGTTLGLDYLHIRQTSEYSPKLLAFGLLPQKSQDVATFSLRQELIGNVFGKNDSAKRDSAEAISQKISLDVQKGREEYRLKVLKLFWDTFAAHQAYKQSLASRDKQKSLVGVLERKSSKGFDDKGEFTKARAELENQERTISATFLMYDMLLKKLFISLNMSLPDKVDFSVDYKAKAPPQDLIQSDAEKLRKISSAKLSVQSAESDLIASKGQNSPALAFVAKAAQYGFEDNDSGAMKEMTGGSKPKYFVGLEFNYRFGSKQLNGDELQKIALKNEAYLQLEKTRNEELDNLNRTASNLQIKYAVLNAANESVKLWEKAIKEQETNYRVGRISTFEFTSDYGSYFRSRSAQSQAYADYKYAGLEYLAVRDQLLTASVTERSHISEEGISK